jgi:four helix bundle protein
MTDDEEYEAWARGVPAEITTDTLWRTPAYRFSLYLMSQAQADLEWILEHRGTRALADQLLRAVGGISASLDEGYSRSSGRERAHYYEYALGSAREARGWYYKCSIALPPDRAARRLACLSRIVRILTAVVPRERARTTEWRARRNPPSPDGPPDHQQPVPANSNTALVADAGC